MSKPSDRIAALCRIAHYAGISGLPSILRYLIAKILRRSQPVVLSLRNYRWVIYPNQFSGLVFFEEVILHGSYAALKSDLLFINNPVVLDVGANCGAFALWILNTNPEAIIYSFEPGPSFAVLSRNIIEYQKANGGLENQRWQAEKWAISSENGFAYMNNNSGQSMSLLSSSGSDRVPLRTLDDIGIAPDILKLDIEGHEMEALKGAESTLQKCRTVILEYHSMELKEQCFQFLTQRHFTVTSAGDHLLLGRQYEI